MNKKPKILYIALLILNLVFFILNVVPIDFNYFELCFGISLVAIGVTLVVRAVNLKIDSCLFMGIIVLGCGILNVITFVLKITNNVSLIEFMPYYVLTTAIASLITSAYFKDKLQFKIFILCLGVSVLTFMFVKNLLMLWLYVVLLAVWLVGFVGYEIVLFKKGSK